MAVAGSLTVCHNFVMGNTLLKWKEPLSIFRARHKLSRKATAFKWGTTAILLSLALLEALRHEYFLLFHFVIGTCLFWVFSRVVPTYRIGDAGISYEDGQRRLHHNWSDIEWYYLSPVITSPNMMQVQFSVKKAKLLKTPPAFVFDPQEVDREKLLHILEQHLPQKELKEVTEYMLREQKGPWA